MKRNVYLLTAIVIGLLVFGASIANAQGPLPGGKRAPGAPAGTLANITYQGRLTNSSGSPLNSTVNMVFKLYNSSSVLLWTSATRSVTPVNGLFTVYLGDGSDPNLNIVDVATIGVTVGSDAEMTPRQPLNTVYGHSNTSSGVVGSSNSSIGVLGFSYGGAGVVGATGDFAGIGLFAQGPGATGTALAIYNGGIKVIGAGIGVTTPVFVHVASASNINPANTNETFIDHPLTNGDQTAILIITSAAAYDNFSAINDPSPIGVVWKNSNNKWAIYNKDAGAMTAGMQFNVLVVKP
jgi:hypothetical protein